MQKVQQKFLHVRSLLNFLGLSKSIPDCRLAECKMFQQSQQGTETKY